MEYIEAILASVLWQDNISIYCQYLQGLRTNTLILTVYRETRLPTRNRPETDPKQPKMCWNRKIWGSDSGALIEFKLYIKRIQCFSLRPGGKKARKSILWTFFMVSSVLVAKPPIFSIDNTCMAQGAYIVQYIVNSCRGCWQYTISIVAGIKNHIFCGP